MKYIALDLDGTLLTSDHQLDEVTKSYLIKLQQKGHKIILCSGRSYTGIKPLADELLLEKFDGYIVAYNGGNAYRVKGDEKLFKTSFSIETVKDLYQMINNDAENFVTYGDGTINSLIHNQRIEKSAFIMQAKMTKDIFVASPKVVLQDEVAKIDSIYDQIKLKINEYNQNINVFRSVPHLIEITPKEANKGHGLEKLIEIEKLQEDNLIAFGDGENDLSMLKFATTGIAMGNAMENVKLVADHVTTTNDENGIVVALEKILGEKR